MFTNKLIALLRSFTRQELRRLEALLGASKATSVAAGLISLLAEFHPEFDEKLPEKEWFYRKLFPGSPYKDSRLRLLFSDTYSVARRFAVSLFLEENPEKEALHFAQYLQERGVGELVEGEIARGRKLLQQRALFNINHQLNRWQFDHLENKRLAERFLQSGKEKGSQAGLEDAIHGLDSFFLLERMNYYIWRNAFLKEKVSPAFEQLINEISAGLPESPDELKVMRMVMRLTENMKDEALLKELIELYHSPVAEKLDYTTFGHLFSVLHNCCLHMTWKGKREYQFEQHRLIRRLALLDLLVQGDKVNTSVLCNFAQTCSIFGDVELFGKVFAQCEKFIPKEIRQSTYHFCQAYLDLAAKDFNSALRHLQSITHDSYRRRLFFKTLQIRIFYEKKDDEALLSLADSIRHFLPGAAMLHEEERNYNSRFITFLVRLVRLRDNPDAGQLEKLKQEMAVSPHANWRWLKAKVEELEG